MPGIRPCSSDRRCVACTPYLRRIKMTDVIPLEERKKQKQEKKEEGNDWAETIKRNREAEQKKKEQRKKDNERIKRENRLT
jgi:hypothetical protein